MRTKTQDETITRAQKARCISSARSESSSVRARALFQFSPRARKISILARPNKTKKGAVALLIRASGRLLFAQPRPIFSFLSRSDDLNAIIARARESRRLLKKGERRPSPCVWRAPVILHRRGLVRIVKAEGYTRERGDFCARASGKFN